MEKKDKKDKKKLFVLILFLFAIIALAGYGVYSYFWTEGNFSGTSDTVQISSFDPQTSVNGFVGSGGSVTLTCPSTANSGDTVNCTGEVSVYNNGDTGITVSTSDESAEVNESSYKDYEAGDSSENVTTGTPTFQWSNTTIAANSSENLTITVPVTISSAFTSDTAVEKSNAYKGGSYEVEVYFNLKATQVH